MTKYMGQTLFDQYVLAVLIEKLSTDKDYPELKFFTETAGSYVSIFRGDEIWIEQVVHAAESILASWGYIEKDYLHESFVTMYRMRERLDDEMNPKGVFKKILKGASFQPSHPKPTVRVDLCLENIERLSKFVMTKYTLG